MSDRDSDFIEFFATHIVPDAQIVEDLLEDHGIEYIIRKIEPSAFPMSVGKHGEHRVGVHESELARAIELVRQAIADEAISAKDTELLNVEEA